MENSRGLGEAGIEEGEREEIRSRDREGRVSGSLFQIQSHTHKERERERESRAGARTLATWLLGSSAEEDGKNTATQTDREKKQVCEFAWQAKAAPNSADASGSRSTREGEIRDDGGKERKDDLEDR